LVKEEADEHGHVWFLFEVPGVFTRVWWIDSSDVSVDLGASHTFLETVQKALNHSWSLEHGRVPHPSHAVLESWQVALKALPSSKASSRGDKPEEASSKESLSAKTKPLWEMDELELRAQDTRRPRVEDAKKKGDPKSRVWTQQSDKEEAVRGAVIPPPAAMDSRNLSWRHLQGVFG
jgi:hypothetical protein